MAKIEIIVDKIIDSRMSHQQRYLYLEKRGLDPQQASSVWERPDKLYCRAYIGEALPDKVVRVIKTCIGLIPVTEPWKGII